MLDKGVESRSNRVHPIHWTRIDCDGKVHFSICKRRRKIPLMLDEGLESRSYRKVHFSIRERLRLIPLMLDGFL